MITNYNETLSALPDYSEGAMGSPSIVTEVTPTGEVVWNFTTGLDFTQDMDRLPNENTIIAVSSLTVHNERVIEVTPAGEIVLEYHSGYVSYPNDCNRLPWHTLISFRNWNTMIEMNP